MAQTDNLLHVAREIVAREASIFASPPPVAREISEMAAQWTIPFAPASRHWPVATYRR